MALAPDITRSIELVALCQNLQSEKDGVDRPALWEIDKTKTLDAFASDISRAARNLLELQKYRPIIAALNDVGLSLYNEGKVEMQLGDNFYEAAMKHIKEVVPAPELAGPKA
jgi:hypothetical protein